MDMETVTEIHFSELQNQLYVSGEREILLESKSGMKKDLKISCYSFWEGSNELKINTWLSGASLLNKLTN